MNLLVICINVKVFELIILLSSAMNMVKHFIYLGRMEVELWYYAFRFFMPPGTIVPMGAYCFYCVRMYVCMYVCMYVRVWFEFG